MSQQETRDEFLNRHEAHCIYRFASENCKAVWIATTADGQRFSWRTGTRHLDTLEGGVANHIACYLLRRHALASIAEATASAKGIAEVEFTLQVFVEVSPAQLAPTEHPIKTWKLGARWLLSLDLGMPYIVEEREVTP